MIEKLEVTHLRTLDALYKCRNLSLAAEYLNVSQQAISLQLKKLREILNDQLFVRTGHGVSPTPYAKLIEPHVQKVLTCLSEIPLPYSVTPTTMDRTLVVCATDYTQKIIVGELVKALRDSAPNVKIMITNIESTNLTKKMSQGEIDLALTSHGYVPEGLVCKPLFVEQYRCVTANRNITFNDYLPLNELVKYDFLVITPGTPSFTGSADAWFEQQNLPRNVMVSVPSFFMAQEYLKQSELVGFLPSRLLPCEGLIDIPLNKYPPGYEVVAAYHPKAAKDPLITWLLSLIMDRFAVST